MMYLFLWNIHKFQCPSHLGNYNFKKYCHNDFILHSIDFCGDKTLFAKV